MYSIVRKGGRAGSDEKIIPQSMKGGQNVDRTKPAGIAREIKVVRDRRLIGCRKYRRCPIDKRSLAPTCENMEVDLNSSMDENILSDVSTTDYDRSHVVRDRSGSGGRTVRTQVLTKSNPIPSLEAAQNTVEIVGFCDWFL